MPAISKIISKVILDRRKDHLYSTIDREQAGFRPGSTQRRRGIPNKLVSVIKSTYNGSKFRVLHNDTISAAFVVGSGVRQGCIVSPVLFLVVIGDIIQATLAKHHSVSKYSGIRWQMDIFL